MENKLVDVKMVGDAFMLGLIIGAVFVIVMTHLSDWVTDKYLKKKKPKL